MDSINEPRGAGGDDVSLTTNNNGDAPSDSGFAGNNVEGTEVFDAAGDTSTPAAVVADVLTSAQNTRAEEEEDAFENHELSPAAVGTAVDRAPAATAPALSQITSTDEAPVPFSHVSSTFEDDDDKKKLASQRTSRSPEIDEAPVHFSLISSDSGHFGKKMQAGQRTSSGPQIDQVNEDSIPFDDATVVERDSSVDQATSNDTSLASVQDPRTTITTCQTTVSDNSAAASRPSVASLPLLRATVVEEPTDPVFEGVQVAHDETLPWWKRHRLLLSLVVVLLMAVIVSTAIASTNRDRKLEPTSPSSDETSLANSYCENYRLAPGGSLLECDYCFLSVDIDNNDVVIGSSISSNEVIQFLTYGGGKTENGVALNLNSSIASVAISGDAAVAGTLYGSSTLAYIFEKDSLGIWSQVMQVDPDYVEKDTSLGNNVDIDEDVIVIGHEGDGENMGGSAFVYRRTNGTWLQEAKLVPDDLSHNFGQSVSVKGDFIAVGDAFYGDAYQGAVFVYEYDFVSKSWDQLTDPITNDDCNVFFGSVVELSEDNALMIGCYSGEENFTGVVYSYSLSGEGHRYELLEAILPSGEGAKSFGEIDQIAVDGNFMLVTANLNERVFFFAWENNVWKEFAEMYIPDSTETYFGHSVALSGRNALVSSGTNLYSYFIEDC